MKSDGRAVLACSAHQNTLASPQVEIDTEVPAAEFQGIAEQMSRLEELEDLQGDWLDQAEARDEVRVCVCV